MEKALAWIGRHGAAIAAFAGGVLVGALLRYPTGWNLPDSSANVIGAAAGALLSVGGAFIVLKRQLDAGHAAEEARQKAAIKLFADEATTALLDVQDLVLHAPGRDYNDIKNDATHAVQTLQDVFVSLKGFGRHRFELGIDGMRAYRLMLVTYERIMVLTKALASTSSLAFQQEEARTAYSRAYAELCRALNELAEEMASYAGDDGYRTLRGPDPD